MYPVVASSLPCGSTLPGFVSPPLVPGGFAAPTSGLRIRTAPAAAPPPCPLRRRGGAWPLAATRTTGPGPTEEQEDEGKGLPLWARAGGRPWRSTLLLMAVYSAILGPFLDGYHGRYGVLVYDQYPINVDVAGAHLLGTSVWVPPMFAVAGLIMTILYLLLDQIFDTPAAARRPGVPQVMYGISLFSFQYALSGILVGKYLWDYASLNALLFALAAACFALFDRTKTGLVVGFLTMLSGPLLEVGLITFTELYHYTAPDSLGLGVIPSFILPVYLAGAPAVGNLARLTWNWVGGGEEAAVVK